MQRQSISSKQTKNKQTMLVKLYSVRHFSTLFMASFILTCSRRSVSSGIKAWTGSIVQIPPVQRQTFMNKTVIKLCSILYTYYTYVRTCTAQTSLVTKKFCIVPVPVPYVRSKFLSLY